MENLIFRTAVVFFATSFIFLRFSFGAPSCELLLAPESQVINKYMAEKYPELRVVVENTDEFIISVQEDFARQKRLDPKNPHSFDYARVTLPTVKYAVESIQDKVTNLSRFRQQLENLIQSKNPWNRLFRKKLIRKLKELDIALLYLADLQTEGSKYLNEGKITYKQSIEYLYFFTRAIGHFDMRQFPFLTRMFLAVDRYLQGYEQHAIQTEYDHYKNRTFTVFQKESPVDGFKSAQQSFEQAFHNQNQLGTIFVPSHVAIDRDILMRLMNRNINIIGVTADPIAADGFLRPSGDFWVHDVRHESAKLQKRNDYVLLKQPTDEQLLKLDALQEKWMLELHNEWTKIEDADLKEAVSLLSFNYHHDRGFPMIPSAWISGKHEFVMHGLLTILAVSGQGIGYKKPIRNTLRARKWMSTFWLQKLPEENAVFGN